MADEEDKSAEKKAAEEKAAKEKAEIEQWAEDAAHEKKRIDGMTAITKKPEALALYAYKRGGVEEFRDPGILDWAQAIVDVANDVGAREDLVEDIARERDGDEAGDDIAEAFENPVGGEEGIAPDHDEHEDDDH